MTLTAGAPQGKGKCFGHITSGPGVLGLVLCLHDQQIISITTWQLYTFCSLVQMPGYLFELDLARAQLWNM